ncbi:MAG: ribosome biogenesis GTPase Der [Gammaproteobacteria bacterium]|nr:ribosome biogenesis GTPase Der [Gammaproteobacteria bacterium]
MLPVIALVGRPNVGKSTLFNRLTRSRDALVADYPGLTRDRIYGTGRLDDRAYLVIDTGGMGVVDEDLAALMERQARVAIDESDMVLFLVDAREGIMPGDQAIADTLRRSDKAVRVVINKADGMVPGEAIGEFHALGLGEPVAISATRGDGVSELMGAVLAALPAPPGEAAVEPEGIRVAVLGRPNVGKSTLVNRLLGEERVLTSALPGTTRDAVRVPFERDGQRFTLIDTAGVRRRRQVTEGVEKLSVVKALQAIESCDVVVMVLDAREGVVEQDARVLGHVVESGRGLVIAVNKWDHLSPEARHACRRGLDRKLGFVRYAPVRFISALHGSGIAEIVADVSEVHRAATADLGTGRLNQVLRQAVAAHPPPLVRGRRIKLRYAHQGGANPPVIVVHGTQAGSVPEAYRRYLANRFREAFRLTGTPLRLVFRTPENPYAPAKPKR